MRIVHAVLPAFVLASLIFTISCCCFGGLGDDEIIDYAGGPGNWHNEGYGGDA